MPEVVGLSCQAVVRLELHVDASYRVSTSSSLGDKTSVLQLRDPWVCPAVGDITSTSMAVGLVMVLCRPTIAW